jgi:hypothetical protein
MGGGEMIGRHRSIMRAARSMRMVPALRHQVVSVRFTSMPPKALEAERMRE